MLRTRTVQSLQSWQMFYRDVFGIELDLESLQIPRSRKGFSWLLVVAQGLTAEILYKKCNTYFRCTKFTENSLDDDVPTNDRIPQLGAYAIWLRRRTTPDREYRGHSVERLDKEQVLGVTLLERLLLELKFYIETGKHLDYVCATLCSGSRHSDPSFAPLVYWHHQEYKDLKIDWHPTHYADTNLGTREVVST